ncbi:hypothetical protein GCM10027053_18560 [Intrasporangium mesophilum]
MSQRGCPAASPTASPTAVHPGDTVRFSVDYSDIDDCVDLFVNGTPIPPRKEGDGIFRDVEITWSDDGTTTVLATLDADRSNQLRATVTVPVAAPSGLATLSAGSADNVIMTVTPRRA